MEQSDSLEALPPARERGSAVDLTDLDHTAAPSPVSTAPGVDEATDAEEAAAPQAGNPGSQPAVNAAAPVVEEEVPVTEAPPRGDDDGPCAELPTFAHAVEDAPPPPPRTEADEEAEALRCSHRARINRHMEERLEGHWRTRVVRTDGVRVLPSCLSPIRTRNAFPQEPPRPSALYPGLMLDAAFWRDVVATTQRTPVPTVARLTAVNVGTPADPQLVRARELFGRYHINGLMYEGALAASLAAAGAPASEAQARALIRCANGTSATCASGVALDEANFTRVLLAAHAATTRAMVAQRLLNRTAEQDAATLEAAHRSRSRSRSRSRGESEHAAIGEEASAGAATPSSSQQRRRQSHTPSRATSHRSPSPASTRLPPAHCVHAGAGDAHHTGNSTTPPHTLKSLQIASRSGASPTQRRQRPPASPPTAASLPATPRCRPQSASGRGGAAAVGASPAPSERVSKLEAYIASPVRRPRLLVPPSLSGHAATLAKERR